MKKDAIIAYFKTKYPALNLRKTRLDAIAARLEDKVQDESELESKLDALNEVLPFADIAKDDDAKYEAERKAKEAGQKKPDNPKPEDSPKDDEKPEDVPSWAKALIDSNNALKSDIASLKTDKVVTSRRTDYEKNALKGVSDLDKARALKNFDRLTKDMSDEEFDTWKEEETQYHQERLQQQNLDNLGGLEPQQSTGASGKPSDKELDAITDAVMR